MLCLSLVSWGFTLCLCTPEPRLMELDLPGSGKRKRESKIGVSTGFPSCFLKGQALHSLIFHWPNQVPCLQFHGQGDEEVQCYHVPTRKGIQKLVKSSQDHPPGRKRRRGFQTRDAYVCGKSEGLEHFSLGTALFRMGWSPRRFHILMILSIQICRPSFSSHQDLALCLAQNYTKRT